MNNQVLIALISSVGGVVITYITVKYKSFVFKPPKDRVATIFDGYEALIKQQQAEIARKSVLVDKLEEQLNKMEELVDQLRADLQNSQSQIEGLSGQLTKMRVDYGKLRAADKTKSARGLEGLHKST